MTKFFWSIPGIAIYVYVINILAQYGWNMYYKLPASFIDASIASNTTFLHLIISSIFELIKINLVGDLIFIIIVLLIIYASDKFNGKKSLIFLVTLMAFFIGWEFYDFGFNLAKVNGTFFVAESGCLPEASSTRYVAPIIYNNNAVFIPINNDNKMEGGFLVKDLSQMSCVIKMTEIGQLKR